MAFFPGFLDLILVIFGKKSLGGFASVSDWYCSLAGFPGNVARRFFENLVASLFRNWMTAFVLNLATLLLGKSYATFLENFVAGFFRNLATFLSGYLTTALPGNLVKSF